MSDSESGEGGVGWRGETRGEQVELARLSPSDHVDDDFAFAAHCTSSGASSPSSCSRASHRLQQLSAGRRPHGVVRRRGGRASRSDAGASSPGALYVNRLQALANHLVAYSSGTLRPRRLHLLRRTAASPHRRPQDRHHHVDPRFRPKDTRLPRQVLLPRRLVRPAVDPRSPRVLLCSHGVGAADGVRGAGAQEGAARGRAVVDEGVEGEGGEQEEE